MIKVWSAGPGVVAQSKALSAPFPSDDLATDLFSVLFSVLLVAALRFERFRRLLEFVAVSVSRREGWNRSRDPVGEGGA